MSEESAPSGGRKRARALLEIGAQRELTAAEHDELIRLLHDHPGVEHDEFAPELAALGALGPVIDEPPPPALREQVAAAAERLPGEHRVSDRPARRWSLPLFAAAAVALIALGGAGSALVGTLLDEESPSGQPGALGAVETIDFDGEPAGVDVDASVVAHTWGTETLLDLDGLTAGKTFTVVVIGTGGEEFPSGEFIGSAVRITCEMNAAVLRQDVASIEIRDSGGGVVMASDLPPAAV